MIIETKKYEVVESTVEIEGTVYDTYGIAYGDIVIHDVSVDRAFVEHLVDIINENELDPVHLRDVVEDSLI